MVLPRSPATAVRTVEERLGALDRGAFVAFCAALWRARGYDVRHEGRRLVATRGDERTRILPLANPGPVRGRLAAAGVRVPRRALGGADTVGDGDGDADGGIDVVVTAVDAGWATRLGDRHDARLVGPTELANRLLYAISRDDADELTTRYLGVPTSELRSMSGSRSPSTQRPSTRSTTALVVAGVVCLVLAGFVGGAWTPAAVQSGGIDKTDEIDEIDAATPVPTASHADRAVDDWEAAAGQYPPGVSAESLDASRLAAAHAAAVSGRSYRLITRQSGTETLDGSRRWNGAWQHAVVADERRWLYVVVGYEDTANGTRLVQYTAYADGEFVYRRADTNDGPQYDRSPVRVTTDDGFGPHTDRARRALERYLAATRIEVDRPSWQPDLFRIVATGRPTAVDGDVSNYTATAFVSREGFVSELTVEYTRHEDDDAEAVRFRFEYAAVDETQVKRPGWYDDARAATAANVTSD